ncbi:MAG: BON domain-containing protein, partial [Pseudomonadota bacterium]
ILAPAICAVVTLSGCAEAIVGVAARGANAALEERTVGAAIDDATIKLELNAALLDYSGDVFRGLDSQVVEGRVLLTGTVEQTDDAIAAVRIAWSITGVREVIDEIQTSNSSGVGGLAKDAWISAQLRTRLLSDADVWHLNYTIKTNSRVIYLMGIASSPEELLRVVDHARSVPDVERVVSHVLYRQDPRRTAPIPATGG